MFGVINKEMILITKLKSFIEFLENSICNIPRKDEFYKLEIRKSYISIYKNVNVINFEHLEIKKYRLLILADISYLMYLLEIILKKDI